MRMEDQEAEEGTMLANSLHANSVTSTTITAATTAAAAAATPAFNSAGPVGLGGACDDDCPPEVSREDLSWAHAYP